MLGRLAFGLSGVAVLWSAALVVAAFTAPLYSVSGSGASEVHSTGTLVGVNGLYAAFVAAIPLLVAALVWWALHRTCTTPGTGARALAVTLTVLLLVFCLLTGFTIGMFALPVALALCAACALTPDPVPATA